VTNEGNAGLSGNVPKLRICSVGIEKVIPGLAELGVFIRLLIRSGTGERITQYTSHFAGGPDRPLSPSTIDDKSPDQRDFAIMPNW
jgi:L-lactate utilization protein LutB